MWSLPDISALNRQAVQEHKKRKGRAPSPRGKQCEVCGEKAKYVDAYHDIFGDEKTREVPKGHITLCARCYEMGPMEGFFFCDGCSKTHIENYTWELYYRDTEAGRFCLACEFDSALLDESFWVYQDDLDQLKKWVEEGKYAVAFEWIRNKAKHLIAVGSTYWEEKLIFQGNVELDGGSGGRLTSSSTCEPTVAGGVCEIIGKLEKVLVNTSMRDFLVTMGQGPRKDPRCALILDGAFQFAVSIGIYFERKFTKKE